jgi:hypothetical protein
LKGAVDVTTQQQRDYKRQGETDEDPIFVH